MSKCHIVGNLMHWLNYHIQVNISWLFFFQVFLLTDGEVYNTKEVIGLVKANAEKAR